MSEHHHHEGCDCGHDHHEHTEHCGCGHDHHEHTEHCDCGHDHRTYDEAELTEPERRILHMLAHCHYLPIARYTMTSSKEDELYSVAMEPVYITDAAASMEDVRADAAPFASLAEKGLITLDYDIPLQGYDYAVYDSAALTAYFRQTVAESAGRPGFLFDTACIEKGSVALAE